MTDSTDEIREADRPKTAEPISHEIARAVIFFYLFMSDLGVVCMLQSADPPFRGPGWEGVRFMMPLTVVLAPLLFFRPERVPTWIFGVALAPGALLILLSGVGFSNPILVMVLALAASETAYCMIMLDIVLGRMTEKKTTADS